MLIELVLPLLDREVQRLQVLNDAASAALRATRLEAALVLVAVRALLIEVELELADGVHLRLHGCVRLMELLLAFLLHARIRKQRLPSCVVLT